MMVVRFYYQSKVLCEKRAIELREGSISIIVGAIAALTTIVFGAEYIFFPDTFSFAYLLRYPDWIRWLGGFVLAGGISMDTTPDLLVVFYELRWRRVVIKQLGFNRGASNDVHNIGHNTDGERGKGYGRAFRTEVH
jgi:hypothetical protein